jgi:hypothetical protein
LLLHQEIGGRHGNQPRPPSLCKPRSNRTRGSTIFGLEYRLVHLLGYGSLRCCDGGERELLIGYPGGLCRRKRRRHPRP